MNAGRIVSIVLLTGAGNGNLLQYMVKVLGGGAVKELHANISLESVTCAEYRDTIYCNILVIYTRAVN